MNKTLAPIAPKVLEKLKTVPSATATLILLKKFGIRNCYLRGVKALNPAQGKICAEAYTLRFIPHREDLSRPEILGDQEYAPRKVIETVPEGSALVIDARGVTDVGVVGGIFGLRLHQRGCAAVITDGAVRDARELSDGKLPIYCNGTGAPASITMHYGADYQVPIGCGGAAIIPGDYLIGDEDGVIVVPRACVETVAIEGAEQERLEGFLTSLVEQGRPTLGTYPPNEETRAEYDAWVASLETSA
ncbi:ribonuclease activity regulator RraA [uncultured Ruegeria sp.]|uniref:RraA family protein n=1 Tax=uncultured Ruegeria sp. TaxID=259304 RepID=UPI00262E8136|nr:ribonuclease activity regulator RraA [uncultured Ruegeria sp.]